MPVLTGSINYVTTNPDTINEIWVRAPKIRTYRDGIITTNNDRFPVKGNTVTFPVDEGEAVIALISQGRPVDTIPILVDSGFKTLKQAVDAGRIAASDPSQENLREMLRQFTMGVPGPRGDKGEKGDVGERGPRGFDGVAGQRGEKGETGVGLKSVTQDKQKFVFTGDNGAELGRVDYSGALKIASEGAAEQVKSTLSGYASSAEKSATSAASDANRAEQASKETIAQVQGDYATRPYVDSQVWDKGMLSSPTELLSLRPGRYGIFSSKKIRI